MQVVGTKLLSLPWHPRVGEGSSARDLRQAQWTLKELLLPKSPYHTSVHRDHRDANFINKVKDLL